MNLGQTILAIDIGSTKTCAVIAEVRGGIPHFQGVGITPSNGLKKGTIVNIELAARSIKTAVENAKRMAGIEIGRAVVSISGAYTKGLNAHGIVNIPNREITLKEINRAIQTALYNANITGDLETIHVLPFNFKVDEYDNIEDPIDMSGSRLEVDIHVVAVQKSSLENLRKAVRLSGLEIDSIVLSAYASSISVLSTDEKELGVAVIDIGSATSNMAVYQGNSIRFDDFLAVGSGHITNDLSIALHTPMRDAEKLKIEYGALHAAANETVDLPITGNESEKQTVSLDVVSNIIYARAEETLMILAKSLEKSGFKSVLGAGVVFTGGITRLEGLRELAAAVFEGTPVRFARPNDIDGLIDDFKDPAYANVIGLVLYAAGYHTLYEIDSNRQLRIRETVNEGFEQEKISGQHEVPVYDEPNIRHAQPQYEQKSQQPQYAQPQYTQPSVAQPKPQKPKTIDAEAARNMLNHIDMPSGKPKNNVFGQMWQWATKLF